jgi:excisionase family DNA binding protein
MAPTQMLAGPLANVRPVDGVQKGEIRRQGAKGFAKTRGQRRNANQTNVRDIGEPAMKVFTTGQVAKICKVAPRTVSKWFDSGRLRGYRIPGSQDRRIPREYLIKFLKEHGMPLGDLEDEAMAKVLIVAQDQVLVENVKRELPLERSFKLAVAASGFDAGIQAESFHPDCIIVDFSIGRTEALQICQNLRRNTEFADVILIALLPDDGSSISFDRSSINETFKKPFDAALLAERLRTLIGAKKELV